MLLALATPKLCDLFSLALVSPLPLWREGEPAVEANEESVPTPSGQCSTHMLQLWSQHSATHQPMQPPSHTQRSSTPVSIPTGRRGHWVILR